MVGWLTDKRFLVGAAVGFFLVPRIATYVRAGVGKVTGSAAS